jgi:hypothetical protein
MGLIESSRRGRREEWSKSNLKIGIRRKMVGAGYDETTNLFARRNPATVN